MSLATAVVAATILLGAATPDANAVVERAVRAVEGDSAQVVEARWLRVLAAKPTDKQALLGLSTLARITYRFARADSLARQLIATPEKGGTAAVDDYSILARMGIAHTLAVGANPARADSLLTGVRRDAQLLGSARLESGAVMALALIRARTRGVRTALDLIAESRRVYPVGTPRENALRMCVDANFRGLSGDTTAATRLTEGLAVAKKSREWRVYAECRLFRAQMLEHRGYFDNALDNLDSAVFWMRHVHSDASLAIALQWGGYVRFQNGDLAKARVSYLESIALAARTHDTSVESWAYTGLADIALALRDLSGGQEYLARALAMHRERNDRWGYASVRELEGELLDALGDISAARAALTEAVTVHVQNGSPVLAVAPLRRLARLELAQGRVDDADRALTRATQLATTTKNQGWFNELPYHQAGVAIARGQLDAADSLLRSMQRLDQFTGLSPDLAYAYWIRSAVIASRRNDLDATEQSMLRATNVFAEWRRQFGDKDVRLQLSQARRAWGNIGDEYPALVARLARAGRIPSAFALAEASRARELLTVTLQQAALNTDSARRAAVVARARKFGDVATLAQVQQHLDDSTALLAYVAGRGREPTTVFVVSRNAAVAKTLAPIDSIATALERYVRLTADGNAPITLARQLSDALLTDAIAALPAGISRLLIVPELSLYRLPFDALPLSDGRFVAEQFTTAVVPSATYAVSLASATPRVAAGTLLAFGDATYASAPSLLRAGLQNDSEPTRAMPRLPFSGDEVRRIARYSKNARVLVRGEASENALRNADLRAVRVLHFATHALIDDRSLQRNMLALSPNVGNDGMLGPTELGALKLNNALVVLSGCRTVGGIVLGGEGLRGLTAPLLEAGARAVVATQWAIGDESILPFVDRFYSHLSRGVDVGTALRRAKLDAIRDHVRPSVWAAFVLVGDGTMHVPLTSARGAVLPWAKTETAR